MTHDVKTSIDHIRNLSPKLNEATNNASAVVQAVEKFLDDCGVGMPVDIEVSSSDEIAINDDDERSSNRYQWTTRYLSYRRVAGSYQIAVVEQQQSGQPDGYDSFSTEFRIDSERVVPWSSAPRHEKLTSFARLADLLKEIAQRATKSLEAVEASGNEATAILQALTGKDGDKWANDATVSMSRKIDLVVSKSKKR